MTSQIARLVGAEGAEVFAWLGDYDPERTLAVAERARRAGLPSDLIAAAMTQLRLRARAAPDLGPRAHAMFFTDTGLQQATRWLVARLHATRFVAAGVDHVVDLGCGLGIDALAFAEAGLGVIGYELDRETSVAAAANLARFPSAEVRRADVLTEFAPPTADTSADDLPPGVAATSGAWLDPARRSASGKRIFDPRQASPPLSFILDLARRLATVGAKLAPGVDRALLPNEAETQWISLNGDLLEATLWFGTAAVGGRRSALLLSGERQAAQTLVVANATLQPSVADLSDYLLEPDPAVIRCGGIGEVAARYDATLLDETIAYLSCARPVAPPIVRCYRVVDVMPFSLKGLRSYLRQRQVGVVTIKKRGTAVEPAQLRTQLRLRGTASATIVLTRLRGRQSVVVVEPVDGSG